MKEFELKQTSQDADASVMHGIKSDEAHVALRAVELNSRQTENDYVAPKPEVVKETKNSAEENGKLGTFPVDEENPISNETKTVDALDDSHQTIVVLSQPNSEFRLETLEPNNTIEPGSPRFNINFWVSILKMTCSLALLMFCLTLVMTTIFTSQTTAAEMNIHPAAAFFIFWFLISWLATMEGGQGALVGLRPIEKSKYAESHPRTLRNTTLAHKGDNMERFIVGRQFLVVLVVFVINLMASSVAEPQVLGLPTTVTSIFLNSGLALILITIMIGQLTAQVNAATCMLDFLNNYFMLFTIGVSLAIEFSGLLHSVYLVQILFAKICGNPTESTEPPRSMVQSVFFWARVFMSLFILSFALAVTLRALFDGNTTMWTGVPAAVSVIIFFILMCFVGMMEGMQIALFAVLNLPEEELQEHSIAHANCKLTFRDENLQAFLIGRQICVTLCMFVVARVTTLDINENEPNIVDVSDGLQEFFNTGLLGAVITTIMASLAWRIVASSFPLAFLSNPLIYFILRFCLLLEASGICSAAWILGRLNKMLAGFQPDTEYLDGKEESPVKPRDTDVDSPI